MSRQDMNYDDFEQDCEGLAYVKQRGRRDSRSLPTTPKYGSSSTGSPGNHNGGGGNYENQLCTRLQDSVKVSDVMQRRRDLQLMRNQQHHRSYSCKHRRHHARNHFDASHEFRPRTSSMPSHPKRPSTLLLQRRGGSGGGEDEDTASTHYHDDDDEFFEDEDPFQPYVQRVRTFSSSGKGGVINRGDSFKRKQQQLGVAAPSTGNSSRHSSVTSQGSSVCSSEAPCTVLVMGPVGVGKSSLIQQFTTSEYMGGEEVAEDETGCAVPVLLDDVETVLIFKELSSNAEVPTSGVDAYLMIYSIDDHDSFDEAILTLYELRKSKTAAAVILVANKADMVRHRKVTQDEAKIMSMRYDCKFIEVSTVLNMKVDELLAGILKQIRLTGQRIAQRRKQKKKEVDQSGCMSARGIVGKIFKGHNSPISDSMCDLMVI